MKEFNIVLKLLLPLVIGLVLIATISIISNYYFIHSSITKSAKDSFLDITKTLDYVTQKDKKLMEGLIEQLKKDQETINLYKQDNKEWLFNYLHQTYMQLHKKYKLTHFYIHKANKQNYIRVHNKNKNSDMINRTTLKNSFDTLQTSSGIEFGIAHNLTLRVVSPWIVNGELIGFLELGKEVDLITEEYTKFTQSDIVFTVKKELILDKEFNKWKSKNFRNRYYHVMDNYYIIDSTLQNIEENLQKKLNSKEVFKNEYVENGLKKYFINSQNYYDINKNYIGKIFVLKDVTENYEFLYFIILKVTIIVLILLSIMLWYYAKYIRQTESNLNKAYKEIQEISIHDGLTKLYNKQYYLDSVPRFLKKCSRFELYVSFILIDADNFKKYNDNYGHLKGDDVLKEIAKATMKTFQRDNDFCYRVGGEEFLIVTGSNDMDNGFIMAQQLCQKIQELAIEHKYNNEFDKVTVSMGVSTKKITYDLKIEQLYDEADKALYASKENGRNQVTLYKDMENNDEN